MGPERGRWSMLERLSGAPKRRWGARVRQPSKESEVDTPLCADIRAVFNGAHAGDRVELSIAKTGLGDIALFINDRPRFTGRSKTGLIPSMFRQPYRNSHGRIVEYISAPASRMQTDFVVASRMTLVATRLSQFLGGSDWGTTPHDRPPERPVLTAGAFSGRCFSRVQRAGRATPGHRVGSSDTSGIPVPTGSAVQSGGASETST